MLRILLLIFLPLPIVLQAQFPMLIGVSPQECKAYYIEQGMQVYFDNKFPDEPASLIAENRDYTITTMFKDEVAIHASALSKADLSFSMMYEQYEDWVQEGKHKHPSTDDHSIVLSAFETTSEFPKLFIGLYDTQHQAETDQALEVLQCDWGLMDAFFYNNLIGEICGTAQLENPIAPYELWKIGINKPDFMPYFGECENDDFAKREECTNEKILKYIYANLEFPTRKIDSLIGGKVLVWFVVDKTGQLKDIDILEGGNPDLNKEITRVISSIPKLIPGMRNGQEVETTYGIPIHINWQ